MARRRSPEIPEPILVLQQQLEQWRAGQKGRAKLPESFWQSAVDLARRFGVFRTAQPLRLDYTRLKQRLNRTLPPQKSAPAAFVELVRPHAATMEECVI